MKKVITLQRVDTQAGATAAFKEIEDTLNRLSNQVANIEGTPGPQGIPGPQGPPGLPPEDGGGSGPPPPATVFMTDSAFLLMGG